MDLEECKRKGIIRNTRKNSFLVGNLLEISRMKKMAVNNVTLRVENIAAYLPMAYEALRAVLEAFCILHEFKVLSHECLGKLVKDIIHDFDLVAFERYKYARNGINYYGTNVALEEGKALIKGMLAMKKEMELHVKAMLSKNPESAP